MAQILAHSGVLLSRDGAYIMLGATDQPINPRRMQRESLFDAYFWVDDAKAEFTACIARGAKLNYEPHLQPYGVLEFALLDLDDHLIGFGQVIDGNDQKKETP